VGRGYDLLKAGIEIIVFPPPFLSHEEKRVEEVELAPFFVFRT
jgi:hypothetical protein